jgi:hypothetical protein
MPPSVRLLRFCRAKRPEARLYLPRQTIQIKLALVEQNLRDWVSFDLGGGAPVIDAEGKYDNEWQINWHVH